jgi:hypothetical protein
MFKVEFFVEDNKLPVSLRALTGLIRGLPSVVPVVNVKEDHPSGLKPATNGAMLEAFGHHIARLDKFGPGEVKDFLKSMGKSPGSQGYLIKKAVAAKMIKRTGKGRSITYHVVKRLAPPKKEG